MKPTKSNVFCKESMKTKILFESQKKADNLIKFNADDIAQENGYSPVRSYYCEFCAGWHVTSKNENTHNTSRTEKMVDYYHYEKERKKVMNLRNREIRELNAPEVKKNFEIIQGQIDLINDFLARRTENHCVDYYLQCLELAYSSLNTLRGFVGNEKRKNKIEESLNKLRKSLRQLN